jgi:hypothetical protein
LRAVVRPTPRVSHRRSNNCAGARRLLIAKAHSRDLLSAPPGRCWNG